jgi:FG-GAP repeat
MMQPWEPNMKNDSARKLTLLLAAVAALTTAVAPAQTTPPPVVETTLTSSPDDTKFKAPPVGFGTSVGIDGPTAAVGIDLYLTTDAQGVALPPFGRVGIYSRSTDGSIWTRTASIAPNDPLLQEVRFGIALTLKGQNLVVGSNLAVRIFSNSGGSWKQTATIATQTDPSFAFDGRYLVINQFAPAGSPSQTELSVYSVDANGTPSFVSNLPLPDGAITSGVALANGIVAVPAFVNRTAQSAGTPAVYVYSSQSTTPTVPQVLTGVANSEFGASIAIFNQTIVIGAPGEDPEDDLQALTFTSGAAHVYSMINGQWVHTQKVERNGLLNSFGTAVAANEFGALISAPFTPDNYVTVLGETDGYVWRNGQLVLVKRFTAEPGNTAAVSGSEAILGTNLGAGQYGIYEFATILTPASGSTN